MRCINCPKSDFKLEDGVINCKLKHVCLSEDITRRNKIKELDIQVGKKIKFKEEKRYYTIKACDDTFIIATKPYKNTYIYTICNLQDCIRGQDNFLPQPRFDYNKDDLSEALKQLHNGQLEITYRDWQFLNIEDVK